MHAVRTLRVVAAALVLTAAAAFWTATPARAADGDTFAAIAYSVNDGYYGYSYGYSSRAAAEAEALAQCQGNDPQIVVWGRNAHVALAVGNGAYGYAWGSTQGIAERIALQKCRDNGGANARVVVSVNSGD